MVLCKSCDREIDKGEAINVYERGTYCGGSEEDYSDEVVCVKCVNEHDEDAPYAYCIFCGEEAAFHKKDLHLIYDETAFACKEHKDEEYDEYAADDE
ncbi:hypothetical protein QH639_14780 [Lysinibacillus sp. 1 U-2021]|uniref:hypothetical protein n=1 Tax=Lysinibacillus sp. 1 U-2021 TaxID=3039426 RepID=UPI0024807142|nr:hypothetical protein [Lysinibacillus sp. 1 U-2021]WGT37110.1 hypothetical protein QH639_14780 [Lysinibacillus sp. 1 U-2021]